MKKPPSYSQKLKDPRWQKKRLEIMQRDAFTCQACGSSTTTLAIHHIRYQKGLDPWSYSGRDLLTLCEDCHQKEYERRVGKERELLDMLQLCGFLVDDLDTLVLALTAHYMNDREIPPRKMACILARMLGFALGWASPPPRWMVGQKPARAFQVQPVKVVLTEGKTRVLENCIGESVVPRMRSKKVVA